ncbi:CrcB family protein [Streptomyces sp. NPDC048295]|uniref:fluoride efflux transporter FluC n=1 Tax=Streptomyces sp. NPDC048295 TaxID=3154617 RepID=UPI003428BAC6
MEEPRTSTLDEAVGHDVGFHVPGQRKDPRLRQGPVVAAVAVRGGLGATARYGASLLWPTAADVFPWTTLAVNAIGCAVIGVFMFVITDVWAAHRLVRPFFGTGVLGGFTTFSTYVSDVQRLVAGHGALAGPTYLVLTLLAAMGSVWIAVTVTRRVVAWKQS